MERNEVEDGLVKKSSHVGSSNYITMQDTYLWYTRQKDGRSSLQIMLLKKAFPIANFPTYGLWRHSIHLELRRSVAVTNPP